MTFGRRGVVRMVACVSLFLWSGPATAERLPIRTFGLQDGLPSANVACIVPDTKGFLWFCTSEGLARFDGSRFKVYSTADGLPHRSVTAFLESRDGTYWVGTTEGLAHFDPRPAPSASGERSSLFQAVPLPAVGETVRDALHEEVFAPFRTPTYVLHEDPSGTIWCGTGEGLFRVARAKDGPRLVPSEIAIRPPAVVSSLLTDRRGRLWIGAHSGLYRRAHDGSVVDFGTAGFLQPGVNHNIIQALLESRDGWIWVGTEHAGLRLLAPDAEPGDAATTRAWVMPTRVSGDRAAHVVQTADDAIWWVGMNGLRSLRKRTRDDWGDAELVVHGLSSGLTTLEHAWVTEDQVGDLWIAGDGSGALRVTRRGFTTFTEADGLDSRAVHAITAASDGAVVAVTERMRQSWYHNRFDGTRFEAVRFNIPHDDWGWGWSQLSFQDRDGRWWLPTGQAVYRSPPVSRFHHLSAAVFNRLPSPFPPQPFLRAGRLVTDLSDNPPELQAWAAFRLFPDSHGYVWAGTMNRVGGHETPNELVRWDPASDRFEPFPNDDEQFVPMSFAEDLSGGVWIGGYNGGLRRVPPGALRLDDHSSLSPRGQVRALLVDRRGRLWVGSSEGGVAVVDGVDRSPTVARRYGAAEGLSSLSVSSLVEDLEGRVYVGHALGIDVIDVDGAVVRSVTAADGLAPGEVWCAYRDRTGALWFGTVSGLSRFVPASDVPRPAPRLAITAVSVGGRPLRISEVGEQAIAPFAVPPASQSVQIDYAALGASAAVRYQYVLEGGAPEWSAPSTRQSVELAQLASGSYRFLVRAVLPSGAVLSDVGVVPFTVLRPIWAQWWFVSLEVLALGSLLYAAHRTRVSRAVAVERMRLRLARDLHDDLGSNLARLAILGEVAQRDPSRAATVLVDVSTTARRLVETLGEVVWLVDPRKDDLASVIGMVAAHGQEVFDPKGVVWTCSVPREAAEVRLSAGVRKELYLILKEAVTNAATHSQCARAALTVEVGAEALRIDVHDDGRGFAAETHEQNGGNGLSNMQARAETIGAELHVGPGDPGTRVTLTVPRRSRWFHPARPAGPS